MSASIITQGWGAGLGISITASPPIFPNVPLLPGVPQLARSNLFPPSGAPTIGTPATQGTLWQATQSTPVWGVFDSNNNLVVNADAVEAFGARQENNISKFNIQAGQFATYNRVGLPYETSIILTKGGSVSDRAAFLGQVDALVAQTNVALYTIRTSEKTYSNVSCSRYELARRGVANFAYFDVELFFVQINPVTVQYQQAGTDLSNSSVPSAIPYINQALNNPATPPTAVQTSALQAITPPTPIG